MTFARLLKAAHRASRGHTRLFASHPPALIFLFEQREV
jgi:hypothetical protein